MAKIALNLTVKIVVFLLIMLLVAKWAPCNGMVDNFMIKSVGFDEAEKIERLLFGEPDPEPYDSIRDYIKTLINTLISVPLLSVVIIIFNGRNSKVEKAEILREWVLSTLRRFAKIFIFAILFYTLFRFIPYQIFFPENQTYSALTIMAVTGFNLIMTIVIYWFVTKKIALKRNL
ncbi:hypothetical protein [Erwinia sp.]|uniref:hypothetical protein n=1 Tax=Erwinia citreus TaxID=558 RepID=UPI003C762765